MADTPRTTPPATEPPRMVEGEAAGYCDPVTGMCVLPEATTIAPASDATARTVHLTGEEMVDFDLGNVDVSNIETFDHAAFNEKVVEDFRANGGKISGVMAGKNVMLMTTIGAKSGQPRMNPVGYLRDGDRLILIASNGGQDKHPSWYHNLKANPTVTIDLGDGPFEAVATEITGQERNDLYARAIEVEPAFAAYETTTDRKIPVFQVVRNNR